jgi:hypothetical protein
MTFAGMQPVFMPHTKQHHVSIQQISKNCPLQVNHLGPAGPASLLLHSEEEERAVPYSPVEMWMMRSSQKATIKMMQLGKKDFGEEKYCIQVLENIRKKDLQIRTLQFNLFYLLKAMKRKDTSAVIIWLVCRHYSRQSQVVHANSLYCALEI